LAEIFLRKMDQAKFIHYIPGSDDFYTREDEEEMEEQFKDIPLRPLDDTVSIFKIIDYFNIF